MKLHIAIAGYGTAGQAAALMLSADGHHVEVFERAAAPGPVGAGFLLQPTGLGVLHSLGLLPEVLAHGAPVHRLYGENYRGRAVMDIRYADVDARLYGLGLQRGALFEVLHAAWAGLGTLRTGQPVVAVDADAGRMRTADGQQHGPYDLIIAADGSASALRAALGPARLDRPYPWGALWCLVPAEDWPHDQMLCQRYRAARRMIGLLPVGSRPGDAQRKLSFFWSLPVQDFAAWEMLDFDAFRSELTQLWPEAESVFGRLDGPAQLARATYRDVMLRRWHTGRLVLMGDAAHAMSPQLGQGVNMALLDALALRDALRSTTRVTDALQRYAQLRRRHLHVFHWWSRWLTPMFQSHHDHVAWLRDVALIPLGRLPLGRTHMLRVLTGTQHGWLGHLPVAEALLDALVTQR